MNRFDRERLAANLAWAIEDIYRIPRPRERRVAIVAKQVDRAIYIGWRNRGGSIDEITGYST